MRTLLTLSLALLVAALPVMGQVKDHRNIKYPDLPELKPEKPQIFTLNNGLKIFLIEDHEVPMIEVEARIRTGSNYVPLDKTGLSDIFGQVQREGGTESMTGDEIDDFLETRAASIETGLGGDSGFAQMDCLKEDFRDVVRLFSDVLRKPVFEEDKIEVAKQQVKTGIARRNDNVGGVVGREFNKLIRGADSPLAAVAEYETVASVSRDDLVAWHGKYYHPNSTMLGVVGDFDTEQMKDIISEVFGDWERGPDFSAPEPHYQDQVEPGVYYIEKADVTQANIRMGHLGIRTSNPDYYAVQVMNEVLGGGFAGRLFSNVRSKKGLAYSVFGGVGSSLPRRGVFQAGMSTQSEKMAESVEALKAEVLGIIETPPTPEEMKRAKESIRNSFVFNYTSKGQILSQQMLYDYYGYPADFLETRLKKIEAVTQDEVAAVAKKYIHPDKAVLLVVGNAADFDRPVDSFGSVATLDISIPPPADTTPKLAKNAASLEAGSALFAKAASLIAAGGDKLESVKAKYSMAISAGGQEMALGQEYSVQLPDKMRMTINSPMGAQTMIFNGDKGVMEMGGNKRELPADQVEKSLKNLQRNLLVLTSHVDDPTLEAVAGGQEEVEGESCDVVAVNLDGQESRLYVDDTGHVLKQSYMGEHPMQGTPGKVEIYFSDYREVDGRMIPHKQVMKFEGEQLMSMSLESIDVNPEIDTTLFDIDG